MDVLNLHSDSEMSMRRDLTQDLFKMLDALRAEVERPASFMGLSIGYNKYDLAEKIDKIRASMPREFRDAASIAREAERMTTEAKQEAEAMLTEAHREAQRIGREATLEAERTLEQARLMHDQLVSEHEVLRVASHQSVEIKQAAERESRQLRRESDRYAHGVLSKLEGEVGKILATVERGRQSLAVETVAAVEPERERARV